MASRPNRPITVALVDDYDVVVMGVANMFDKYRDRIVVAELDSNMPVDDTVVSSAPPRARSAVGLDWPGRGEGLSDRESEILALITQGKSNAEVAKLTYLSPNTVKSYIRSIYRKIGVGSRTQAVLWGVDHGFTPDHHRIEHWRGGP